MRRYILCGWRRLRQFLRCIQAAGQLKQARSLDRRPCKNHYQISTRTMTVKKTGHESDQISKEPGPNSGESDAGHVGRFPDFFDSEQPTYNGHEIAQECSLDAAKIVEVHRRIESGEYTVNTRRIAGKLFELESQLRILD